MNPVTCATCAESLPENEVSVCNPKTMQGQIRRGFLTLLNEHSNFTEPATPTISTSVNSSEAWSDRMDQTAQSDGAIVTIHMIGNKPRPEVTKAVLSLNRSKVTNQAHQIPFEVDEVNPKSHDFWRKISQCGGTFGLWYEAGNKVLHLFGSSEGVEAPIRVSIAAGMVIPVEIDGLIKWVGEFTWDDLGTENFIASPVPDAPEPVIAS